MVDVCDAVSTNEAFVLSTRAHLCSSLNFERIHNKCNGTSVVPIFFLEKGRYNEYILILITILLIIFLNRKFKKKKSFKSNRF